MQTKEELLQHKEIDGEMLKAAYDKAAELITIATDEFTEKFPSSASIHNFTGREEIMSGRRASGRGKCGWPMKRRGMRRLSRQRKLK